MNAKAIVRSLSLVLLLATAGASAAAQRARNVILFIGDAGGLPTLNAAGIYAHDKPQSLYLHSMPHIALSDTSALNEWVSDSAAGMTAIVAGHKTNNGMVSVVPAENGGPVRTIKTLLEYAEERGLSTGVVTNMPAWDATPAACYAHVDSRRKTQDIYAQFLEPRFGDGVDILIGSDRKALDSSFGKPDMTAEQVLGKRGYRLFDTPTALTADVRRAVSIFDGEDFAPIPVVDTVLKILGANRKGYFLMVEWDNHADDLKKGLDRVIVMDDLIRHVSRKVGKDTLIVFAADHSFGLRMRDGKPGTPYAEQFAAASAKEGTTQQNHPLIAVDRTHTGEEVVVAARGPGAERVHGFIPNTQLFKIMMAAYGWKEDRQ